VSSVDQAVIDLDTPSIWGVPGLEVDSFVHKVRTFDRDHVPVCGKVDQTEAISISMQAVFAYRWLMYGANS
jgi:hypothetical protein